MAVTRGISVKPRQLRERYCASVDANVVQRAASVRHGRGGEDFICYNKPSCRHGAECRAGAPETN